MNSLRETLIDSGLVDEEEYEREISGLPKENKLVLVEIVELSKKLMTGPALTLMQCVQLRLLICPLKYDTSVDEHLKNLISIRDFVKKILQEREDA